MNNWQQREATRLSAHLAESSLATQADQLLALHRQGWAAMEKHGDLTRWQAALAALPDASPTQIDLDCSRVTIGRPEDTGTAADAIASALMGLHPWRKGPFELFGVHIDTEWRSDLKWDRLKDAITPLAGRHVLDIGCGSGYHLWRMLGAGAKSAIGIDPTALFAMQFAAIKRYIPDQPAFLLPVGIEAMPGRIRCFDSVFSMGILYHRRAPIDHLFDLRSLIRAGGELVIETMVIDGDETSCLMPRGRYAKMRNVWFIPSVGMLRLWLKRAGFEDIRCIDVTATTVDEQRATRWMQFESLADYLDPNDASRTIEGYPAPLRAIFTARTAG